MDWPAAFLRNIFFDCWFSCGVGGGVGGGVAVVGAVVVGDGGVAGVVGGGTLDDQRSVGDWNDASNPRMYGSCVLRNSDAPYERHVRLRDQGSPGFEVLWDSDDLCVFLG